MNGPTLAELVAAVPTPLVHTRRVEARVSDDLVAGVLVAFREALDSNAGTYITVPAPRSGDTVVDRRPLVAKRLGELLAERGWGCDLRLDEDPPVYVFEPL